MGGQLIGTVIGATVGFFIGGPVGAQVGAMLGGLAGGLLDPPKVQGPRLNDTKVRGADYGAMRPILYGMARVGGLGMGQGSTANGPNEFTEQGESSGGKGGSSPTNYRYLLSFFNEICEGPILGVRRRWANGRLVTDVGAVSSDTWPFTLYLGDTTQTPDPTMETIYGVGEVAPMRGVAYEAVTELDVTDYGNARPNVEYEAYTSLPPANLHIVKSNYATGSGVFANMPLVIDWPESGDIIVSGFSLYAGYSTALVAAHTFNTDDLSSTGTTAALGYTFPNFNNPLQRVGIGILTFDGGGYSSRHYAALWVGTVTGTIGAAPSIYATHVNLDDLPDNYVYTDFATECGIPSGEYFVAAAMTQDRTKLFIFTSTVGASSPAEKWYRVETSGESVASAANGTVDPDAGLFAFSVGAKPHGTGVSSDRNGHTMTAENNGRYFWHFLSSSGGTATLYHIDDDDNFASAGTIDCSFPDGVGVEGSIASLEKDGYAGVARGESLVLLSRLGDPGPAILGDIVADLFQRSGLTSDQYDVTDLTQEVRGFVVASQMIIRNAIDVLRKGFFFDVTEFDGKLVCRNRGHDAIDTIPDGDLAAHAPGDDPPEPLEVMRTPEAELPRTVFINYYAADNDYQQGSQYWRRTVTRSQSDVTLDLPIVFTATEALVRAQWHIHFAWIERDKFTFYTTRKWSKLTPTDVVVVRGVNIRITNKTESPNGLIKFDGVRAFAGGFTGTHITDPIDGDIPGEGGSGQPPQTPPSAKAETGLVLLDCPITSDADSATGFKAAIYKQGSGAWPGASLQKSVDDGTNYASVASTTTSSVVGIVATAIGGFTGGNVIDRASVMRVVLASDATLASVTEEGIQNGLNLFAYGSESGGWELLQPMTATLVETNTYDLSNFLRGRFGTEWAMATHAANDVLVLMSSTVSVPGEQAQMGLALKYKAVTSGTAIADATAVDFTNTGVAAKPFAPVNPGGGRDASGNLTFTWTPRRRGSGGWPNGLDLPPTESPEAYLLQIATDATFATVVRQPGSLTATYSYTAALQTADFGSPQSTVYWRVAQAGSASYGYYCEAST